jgi:hypothetical protein
MAMPIACSQCALEMVDADDPLFLGDYLKI